VDGRHEDLSGQVVQGPDYTAGGRVPGSRYWGRHGTSIAGIIAGHGHGTGGTAGVLGVAPLAKILSIRVTWENNDPIRQSHGAALQDRDAVAKGIRYAVDHGANVINMSLGGTNATFNGTAADEAAIKYALDKGVVLVASMGNDGAPPTRKYFPAAYPGVIAVGAVDRKLKPWKDSNQGDYVSVAAPGVGIVSTDTGDAYQVTDGTSASSAIVSGVVALVRSRFPHMTPDQVRQTLQQGVTRQPVSGHDSQVGSGVVDAGKVMDAATALDQAVNGTATPKSVAVSPKATPPPNNSADLLLIGILGGGGVLVTTGLVLGWLQRRRPEDEFNDRSNVPSADDDDADERPALDRIRAATSATTVAVKERPRPTEPIELAAPPATLGGLRRFDPETDGRPDRVNGAAESNGADHVGAEDGVDGAADEADYWIVRGARSGGARSGGASREDEDGSGDEDGDSGRIEAGFGADPLGDFPLPVEGATEVSTPLADASWRTVRRRMLEELPERLSETSLFMDMDDEFEADPFPEVGPVTDLPLQDLQEAPIRRPTLRKERLEDDDYRPPWL
jgi:type VII secretion-associated serine protease mycosin